MCKNISYTHFFTVEMNCCDQSVLVTTNIKHYKAINIICTRKMSFQFRKRIVISMHNNSIPTIKRRLAIRMLNNKLWDTFPSNDVHSLIVSQNEIITSESLSYGFISVAISSRLGGSRMEGKRVQATAAAAAAKRTVASAGIPLTTP
mgnify:CR=1 FL=1